jgi:hypothetical protein
LDSDPQTRASHPDFTTARWLRAGHNLHRPCHFDGRPKPALSELYCAVCPNCDSDFCWLLSRRGASSTGRFTIQLTGQVQLVCPSVESPATNRYSFATCQHSRWYEPLSGPAHCISGQPGSAWHQGITVAHCCLRTLSQPERQVTPGGTRLAW